MTRRWMIPLVAACVLAAVCYAVDGCAPETTQSRPSSPIGEVGQGERLDRTSDTVSEVLPPGGPAEELEHGLTLEQRQEIYAAIMAVDQACDQVADKRFPLDPDSPMDQVHKHLSLWNTEWDRRSVELEERLPREYGVTPGGAWWPAILEEGDDAGWGEARP